jgi:hypothetical protein
VSQTAHIVRFKRAFSSSWAHEWFCSGRRVHVLTPIQCPIATAEQCLPWQWQRLHGSIDQDQQRVAIKVSAQVASATHERGKSACGHLHTASRNRMKGKKAADMTFVFWSSRLLETRLSFLGVYIYAFKISLKEGSHSSTFSGMRSFSSAIRVCCKKVSLAAMQLHFISRCMGPLGCFLWTAT